MFTGLIQTTGTVLALKPAHGSTRLIVAAPALAGRWQIGDSIAVNGVCLTAIDMEEVDERHPGRFAADLADETIRRTTLTRLMPGALVNLELPTPAGSPLGGHVVQGHVDATGRLVSLVPLHDDLDYTDWRLTIDVPPELAPNILSQGSITVDGISLTVARVDGLQIEIAVIPHTYRSTNLHSLLAGSLVNLETDVLSRYAAQQSSYTAREERLPPNAWRAADASPGSGPRLVAAPRTAREWLTSEYLMANGY